VLIDDGGDEPLILDAGTGLRSLGAKLAPSLAHDSRSLHAHLLLTHLHYDHLLGLPFFSPLHDHEATLDIYGPSQGERTLAEVIGGAVGPPFFPVQMDDFFGDVRLLAAGAEPWKLGQAVVSAAPVAHSGPTLGYRIEIGSSSVVYIPDHQAPVDGMSIEPSVRALCDGADLLIHDAQYDDEEFSRKEEWGHSTVAYAVHVAATTGVKALALFHHDPSHSDDRLRALEALAATVPGAQDLEAIFSAYEGLTISLED
jgi:ribonuclease BN (tRNA processing enzyme)